MINKIIFIYLILPVFMINCHAENSQEALLFKYYPNLKEKLTYISLGDFPTPIKKCEELGKFLGHQNIFIKRDDLSGKKLLNGKHLFGGNKIRKLEFLIADALNKQANTVITYGCAGSNHALATVICANQCGLKTILMLKPQPNSNIVQNNLLLDLYYGAQIYFFPDNQSRDLATQKIVENNKQIYFIPTGGSVPLGIIGFVNGILELNEQIRSGQINEPDFIYVALGTCGTVTGILLGLRVLNLKTKVIAVSIEPEELSGELMEKTKKLFNETNKLLNSFDNTFPIFEFPKDQLIINKNFCGKEYGLFTEEGLEAIELLKSYENIILDATYTAKAMAAMIYDIKNNKIKKSETVLFWNSYCGIDFSDLVKSVDYKKLPIEFYNYFE